MSHWCLKKFDYMGGGVLSENRLLTFDRYIKLNVPVSIKISKEVSNGAKIRNRYNQVPQSPINVFCVKTKQRNQ